MCNIFLKICYVGAAKNLFTCELDLLNYSMNFFTCELEFTQL